MKKKSSLKDRQKRKKKNSCTMWELFGPLQTLKFSGYKVVNIFDHSVEVDRWEDIQARTQGCTPGVKIFKENPVPLNTCQSKATTGNSSPSPSCLEICRSNGRIF